ncbi:unnamed protein product [Gadus morhua 'NCC']
MDTAEEADICRVCRSEGTQDKPLYHPCVCTGSIKFIHQECLVQWLKHSRKEYCELCKHRFAFTPIYSPDMPSRLPVQDICAGLLSSVGTAIRYWFHYTLVAFAWLGVVPLTACRIYKCLFTGSVSSLLTLPLDMLSTENLLADCLQGCFVVTCTLCAFISLVWLREQIVHGPGRGPWSSGGPPAGPAPARGPPRPQRRPTPAPDGPPDQNPELEEEEGGAAEDPDANNAAQDDMNWNALEWDRAAEELTWERMLGLDGSLVFLEHVFWVVSLNTLFILVFAFCPYHIGHFSVVGLGFEDYVQASHFEGLITTIVGYILLAMSLILCHGLAGGGPVSALQTPAGGLLHRRQGNGPPGLLPGSFMGLSPGGGRDRSVPLICGWWLDICSLEMFDASLKDRELSFKSAPGTTMFLHWLVGMVYVFYFASFILLLREVRSVPPPRPVQTGLHRSASRGAVVPEEPQRPGLPTRSQEMIHLPIYRHLRRFILSVVVFGSIVLLMLWLPVRLIKLLLPSSCPTTSCSTVMPQSVKLSGAGCSSGGSAASLVGAGPHLATCAAELGPRLAADRCSRMKLPLRLLFELVIVANRSAFPWTRRPSYPWQDGVRPNASSHAPPSLPPSDWSSLSVVIRRPPGGLGGVAPLQYGSGAVSGGALTSDL